MGDKVAENTRHQIQAMRVADGAKRSKH
jgi:hypothetical protein